VQSTMNGIFRSHTIGIVLAFFAGAAAGATIALLTAPQSGRETRRKLKKFTGDLAERAARVPPALHAAYRSATEAGKEAFKSTIEAPSIPAPGQPESHHH